MLDFGYSVTELHGKCYMLQCYSSVTFRFCYWGAAVLVLQCYSSVTFQCCYNGVAVLQSYMVNVICYSVTAVLHFDVVTVVQQCYSVTVSHFDFVSVKAVLHCYILILLHWYSSVTVLHFKFVTVLQQCYSIVTGVTVLHFDCVIVVQQCCNVTAVLYFDFVTVVQQCYSVTAVLRCYMQACTEL